jgi:hypothetical protein
MSETATPTRDEASDADLKKLAYQRACELLEQGEMARRVAQMIQAGDSRQKQAPAQIAPWHEHKAFYAMEGAQTQISRARDAMAGIAALMQPDSQAANEQLNMARRADAFAVFDFFAEALREPLETLDIASNMLQRDLRAGQP